MELLDLPYALRLAVLAPALLLGALWLSAWRGVRPGARRLAAAAPVLLLHCAAPWLLFRRVPRHGPAAAGEPDPDIVTLVLLEFALVWLANFKVLAWVLDRGPLPRPWSRLQFVAIVLAPLSPQDEGAGKARTRGRQGEHAGGPADLLLALGAKAATLAACAAIYAAGPPPPLACEALYTVGLYTLLSFIMDGPSALLSALLGFRVAPHFDAPYLATSVAEFWGRRWNLCAGNALRWAVQEPALEGRLLRAPRRQPAERLRARRLPAGAAAFFVSGLMHEIQFIYLTGRWTRGLMLAFFCVQVPLLVAEHRLGQALGRRGWTPPAPLRTLATLGSLLLLAHATFWRASGRYGCTQSAVNAVLRLAGRPPAAHW